VNKPFFGKPDTCEYDLYTKVAEKSVSAINTRREQFKEVAGCYNKKPLINEYTKDLEIVVAKGSPILDIETGIIIEDLRQGRSTIANTCLSALDLRFV